MSFILVLLFIFLGLLILVPLLGLILGKKYALGVFGLLLGYYFTNKGGFLWWGKPQIVDCLAEFSTCTTSQLFGLLIIIVSLGYMFIPSSKLR